jgi:Zn finger protein HypA/HybF involved in hydrogenase expression|tara:strand:- start:737 stop:931 length:195 start_codon:yes stop_codon:yes gene_type:complete
MPDTSLNISQKQLDSMSCHTCGSKGVRIEKTKDYKEADIDEFNWDDDEWDIIVCNKCGSQDVEE